MARYVLLLSLSFLLFSSARPSAPRRRAAPAAAATAAAQSAAPAGSARLLFFASGSDCSGGGGAPTPVWLSLCTPLGGSAVYDYAVTLSTCDAQLGVTGVAYPMASGFAKGAPEQCAQQRGGDPAPVAFNATPGRCVALRSGNRAPFVQLLGAPSCAPGAAGAVFTLETFRSTASCSQFGELASHQPLAVGACVDSGFVPSEGAAVNASVGVVAGAAAQVVRVVQYDASAAGCAVVAAGRPALPDLGLPDAASGVGNCSAASAGPTLLSYRLLAPRPIVSATPSASTTPSPTLSRGASPSISPTPSAQPTPSVSPTVGSGGGGGNAAAAAAAQATIIGAAVGAPLGALLLGALGFAAMRRLACCSRGITWNKDAPGDTVIVQSPMRPSIYRPTVKAPAAAPAARSAWGLQ